MSQPNNSAAPSTSSSAPAPASSSSAPQPILGSYLSLTYNFEAESKRVPGFICGQCHAIQALKPREQIRCRECGYKILYKERLRRRKKFFISF